MILVSGVCSREPLVIPALPRPTFLWWGAPGSDLLDRVAVVGAAHSLPV